MKILSYIGQFLLGSLTVCCGFLAIYFVISFIYWAFGSLAILLGLRYDDGFIILFLALSGIVLWAAACAAGERFVAMIKKWKDGEESGRTTE